MRNKIGFNILANIVGKSWGFLSIFIFVPYWIEYLGVEGYAVINFYTVLLTLLTFADAGLTATLSREFAKIHINDLNYKQNLLRTFEVIYIGICFFISILVYYFAPSIAGFFLKSETISISSLVYFVRLMGVIISFYFLFSLYIGGLMGLQKQVTSNLFNISYSFVRSGLVLIPLYYYKSIDSFLYWQLGGIVLFSCLVRKYLWNQLASFDYPRFQFKYFYNIRNYAVGMMLMSIISGLNTQIDKLSVGNLLSLEYFGYYSLAATVGQVSLMLTMPIGLAIFPEFTRLVSLKLYDELKIRYHQISYLLATVSTICTIILIFYAKEYVYIWTNDSEIVVNTYLPVIVLAMGNMFMSLQLTPYFLALANAHTRTNVSMGIVSLPILIALIYKLTPIYGLVGAAIPFLILNIVVFIMLGYIIMKKYLNGEFSKWLIFDTLYPMLLNLCVCFVLWLFFNFLPQGFYTIVYGLVIFFTSSILSIFFYFYLNPSQKYIYRKYLKH